MKSRTSSRDAPTKRAVAPLVAAAITCCSLTSVGAEKFSLKIAGDQCAELFSGSPILAKRPVKAMQSVRDSNGADSGDAFSRYIALANADSAPPQVVGIAFDGSSIEKAYTLNFGNDVYYFPVKDIDKIARKIHEKLSSSDFVYWLPSGFESAQKAASFESTLRVQWARLKAKQQIRSIESISEVTGAAGKTQYAKVFDLPESLFAPGATVKSVSKAELISVGQYKGWFRILVRLVVKVGDRIQSLTVAIIVRSASVATDIVELVSGLTAHSVAGNNITAAMVVSGIEREMKKKYPQLSSKDIGFLLQEEFGRNYLVLLGLGVQVAA